MSPVFERITAIADVIIALALVALVGVGVWFGVVLVRARRAFERAVSRIRGDLAPVITHAQAIAGDVQGITALIRSEVGAVSETVDAANERVRQGIAEAETRLGEFNALLDVVQEEAESLFVSTASTVRGFRGGAASFRRRRGPRPGPEFASDELDATAQPSAADHPEPVEEVDGQHGSTESAAEELPATRLRPRLAPGARRVEPRRRS